MRALGERDREGEKVTRCVCFELFRCRGYWLNVRWGFSEEARGIYLRIGLLKRGRRGVFYYFSFFIG